MVADYTELLVVDEVADDYYAERGIVVRSDMPNVIDSAKTHSEEADADRRSSSSSSSAASSASEADDTEPVAAGRSPALVANGRQSVSSESSEVRSEFSPQFNVVDRVFPSFVFFFKRFLTPAWIHPGLPQFQGLLPYCYQI